MKQLLSILALDNDMPAGLTLTANMAAPASATLDAAPASYSRTVTYTITDN